HAPGAPGTTDPPATDAAWRDTDAWRPARHAQVYRRNRWPGASGPGGRLSGALLLGVAAQDSSHCIDERLCIRSDHAQIVRPTIMRMISDVPAKIRCSRAAVYN